RDFHVTGVQTCALPICWEQIGRDRAGGPALDADPRGAWARHVLDAPVMCVRQDDGRPWDVPERLTFREWTRSRVPRAPTRDDLRSEERRVGEEGRARAA